MKVGEKIFKITVKADESKSMVCKGVTKFVDVMYTLTSSYYKLEDLDIRVEELRERPDKSTYNGMVEWANGVRLNQVDGIHGFLEMICSKTKAHGIYENVNFKMPKTKRKLNSTAIRIFKTNFI